MASLRDIRRKISTVKNINKITQAMKMVAAARLRKAQERVDAARPYAEQLRDMLASVAPLVPAEVVAQQPVLQEREPGRIGLVVLSSDRGLCGSYNGNIIRKTVAFLNEQQQQGVEVDLVTVGRRATTGLKNRGWTASESYGMLSVDSPFEEVQVITRAVVGLYTRETNPVSEVQIAYTQFINAVMQRPVIERFLPIRPSEVQSEDGEAVEARQVEYELAPDASQLLSILLPRYVDNQVFQYLLEATASEYGARMTAMSQASDNAGEMIQTLTLEYNRARQDTITKELLDIVGGADALQSE